MSKVALDNSRNVNSFNWFSTGPFTRLSSARGLGYRNRATNHSQDSRTSKHGSTLSLGASAAGSIFGGAASAPVFRSWLTQIGSEYERLEDDSKTLKEENGRLRDRLKETEDRVKEMEEFAAAAREHDMQMEVGDAMEARLMTPARLRPLRASDCGYNLLQDSVFDDAVTFLQAGPRSSTEVSDAAREDLQKKRLTARILDSDSSLSDADEARNTVFPEWFSTGGDKATVPESASMKAEAEIDMWLQQVEASETPNHDSAFILSPVGKFRIIWDFVWFGVLAYDTWVLCFTCAFMANSCSFVVTYNMISLFLIVDLCLNFVTGVPEGDRIIWDFKQIARIYLSSWFWIDVLASIPISTIFCFLESQSFQLRKDRFGEGSLRFARALRVLKFVRLIRIVKIVVLTKAFRQRKHRDTKHSHSGIYWHTHKQQYETKLTRFFARANHLLIRYTSQINALMYTVVLLATLTHVQGCIWGSWHPEWSQNFDVHVAFQRYSQSLWWAYTTLVNGAPPTGAGSMYFLETVMATERVILEVLAGMWIVFQGLLMGDEDAHMMLHKADALEYLQRRGVSTDTQIQLQNSFSETRRFRNLQRRFEGLVEKEVSRELRHMIYIEMWGSKLVSLGLISEMSHWHEEFLFRLTQTVYEEAHGAKAVVCKAGDWATTAYHILEGSLHIISAADKDGEGIPDFSTGMWVGEKALVSTGFRRSNSIIVTETSTLMVVHSNMFHALIDELDLRERFQFFCTDELWKGLCGRCGALGDHFTDECHLLKLNDGQKQNTHLISRDLRMFIIESDLKWVLPALSIMGISTLEDLESADLNELETFVEEDLGYKLSAAVRQNLSVASIQDFKERTKGATKSIMHSAAGGQVHFVFLSHYKLEAGTEASLMRFELEQKLSLDTSGHFDGMDAPVFLDSEDLQSLKDLQERVRNSHNIALILTQGVLTRPWVLIEIVTAWKDGIHIVPVNISKPGNVFQYPDGDFFDKLQNGEIVDESGIQLILESGITLENVATAVRHTFKRIAVTYSPHRPATIRHSEIDEFLRHCRYRAELSHKVFPDVKAAHRRMSTEMSRTDSTNTVEKHRENSRRQPARKGTSEGGGLKIGAGLSRQATLISIAPAEESRPLLE